MVTVGQRIKELRKQKNIKQVDLATATHSSKQTIYKYENDIVTNIPYDKITIIARALGTSVSYLMGWEDEQKNNDIQADIVIRMRTDTEFMETVEMLNALSPQKLPAVKQFLSVL